MNDPFTLAIRLCDDAGMVSHEPVRDDPATLDTSYLARLQRLNPSVALEINPFRCTGHAHLAGEHIRCTSPAHKENK